MLPREREVERMKRAAREGVSMPSEILAGLAKLRM